MNHLKPLLSGRLSATKPWRGRRRGKKRHRRRRDAKRHRRKQRTKRRRRRWGTTRRRRRWGTTRGRGRWRRPVKQGRILRLPDDILLLIFDVLDYTTAIILTRVHSRFWNLVNPATFYSRQRISADIEYAHHTYARFEDRFACHGCFRVLSEDHFGQPFETSVEKTRRFFERGCGESVTLDLEQRCRRRCHDCICAEQKQNPLLALRCCMTGFSRYKSASSSPPSLCTFFLTFLQTCI